MTEQEELIRDIRERLTQSETIRLVMQEAEALGVNYRIGSGSR